LKAVIVKDGSIIAINYTGKIVSSGEVFESTIEKKAIEAGIFSEKQPYEPMVVVVGEGDVLKGLDSALKEMNVGDSKKVLVEPEQGGGPRKSENIRVVPLQHFKKEKMNPYPGLVVEVNGMQGRVQTVSGGRVRVDFNHPLAGKELEYDLKIEGEISSPREQVEALYKKYFYMVPNKEKSINVGKDFVEISLSPRWSANLAPLKQAFSNVVTKHVKGFDKARFVEEFVEEKKEGEGKVKAGAKKEDGGKAKEGKPDAGKEDGGKEEKGKPETKKEDGEKPGVGKGPGGKPEKGKKGL